MKSKLPLITFIWMLLTSPSILQAEVYISQGDFLAQRFGHTSSEQEPKINTIWLNESLQEKITGILGHPYPKLRLRYWKLDQKTVWFLDEIGKERPITFGVSVIDNQIDKIEVIEFRESRGYEIHMEAFSKQFNNLRLDEENQLDGHIDGITEATMSVNAMKKIARLGLLLHKSVLEDL